jgi:hypothetical protein
MTVVMKNKKTAMLEALKKQQQEVNPPHSSQPPTPELCFCFQNFFDSEQRDILLMCLSEDPQTRFLSNLVEGKAADAQPFQELEEAEEVPETVAWDDYEGRWPPSRPHFLTERHWRQLKEHFRAHPPYDACWVEAYARGPDPFAKNPNDPRARRKSHAQVEIDKKPASSSAAFSKPSSRRASLTTKQAFTIQQQQGVGVRAESGATTLQMKLAKACSDKNDDPFSEAPAYIQRYNEFVFANQVSN